jgi:tetratricopeptide (TPR) repeat protein
VTSRIIDLTTAVREIFSAYENREHGQPFFIVAGAGISVPTIPLAKNIIEHCRAKAAGHEGPAMAASSVLDQYSYWFDRAYPQPVDRQRYLRGLIQDKPITESCLRLAHLLTSRRVARLLVTLNFDDFISRSLHVFGTEHTVCDHPGTVDRIDLASQEITIVHAHGSYKFYDCRNLREELEDRARPSERTVRTMAAFLDRALSFSSPLVIGYSGWDGDVVMSALRRRLEGASLPYRLYWFCYNQDAIRDLQRGAPWLVEHPDVRLVAPKESFMEASSAIQSAQDSSVSHEETLPARSVFDAINRGFDLEEPELTRDPVRFFARQLRSTLSSEAGEANLRGVYSFVKVVERLERAADLEAVDFRASQIGEGADVESVRALLRRSQYGPALRAMSLIAPRSQQFERQKLFELAELLLKGNELEPAGALHATELLLTLANDIPAIRDRPGYLMQRLQWLIDKGQSLYQLGRGQEAVATYDEIVSEYRASSEEDVTAKVRYALSRKALALSQIGREEEAIRLYDALIPEFRSRSSEGWLAAQSEFNRATYLQRIGSNQAAVSAQLQFIADHRTAPDGWTQVLVVAAAKNAARLLDAQGETNRGISLLDETIKVYEGTDNSQVSRTVADGLLQLAFLQRKMASPQDAIVSLDRLTKLGAQTASIRVLRLARKLRAKLKGRVVPVPKAGPRAPDIASEENNGLVP